MSKPNGLNPHSPSVLGEVLEELYRFSFESPKRFRVTYAVAGLSVVVVGITSTLIIGLPERVVVLGCALFVLVALTGGSIISAVHRARWSEVAILRKSMGFARLFYGAVGIFTIIMGFKNVIEGTHDRRMGPTEIPWTLISVIIQIVTVIALVAISRTFKLGIEDKDHREGKR